ncbi:MAG: ribonuclease R, partial [Cytophagales bacterium]|nr:ribonuclease R [Cytophagales bacterium]
MKNKRSKNNSSRAKGKKESPKRTKPSGNSQPTKIYGQLSPSGDFDFDNYDNDKVSSRVLIDQPLEDPISSRVELVGKVDFVNPKFAYIVVGQDQEDVWVSVDNLKGALDGDEVKISVSHIKRGKHPEGRVISIVKRGKDEFVGKIQVGPKYAFVVPDSKKMHYDIFVGPSNRMNAKDGEKVLVRLIEWPSRGKKPEGIVTKVLGASGLHETEIHSIIYEFGLPLEFPKAVQQEADAIPVEISDYEVSERRDFRGTLTLTIDPEDAKDFDDALSIHPLGNGLWEIGVHIADVTHYVKEGTELEREAFLRATSVYLVDRTIPMLPEKLSNELCSLRPNEDKLTFSAVFHIDEDAKIHKEWFGRTIIHSQRRFSYEQVQEILESGKGDHADELILMNEMAKKLRMQRLKHGAIGFETVEVKFKLDEAGKPLGVFPKIRKDAHKLIEEFMLLANKQVATFVYNQKDRKLEEGQHKTMVYRIHDDPDGDKLSNLALFAKKFGHKISLEESKIADSLNKMVEDIEGKPEQNILQNLAIRCMAKAKYSTEEMGHFGLAFAHYSHFTSPIRRYPDMMAHRLLQLYLDKKPSANRDEYEEKCKHSSEMEKRAADAERASIKYKQVEFMQMQEKRPFEGIVTGVTEWGLFVEMVETRCEGLVRYQDFKDDFYEFDEKNIRAVGKKSKNAITLG